MTTPIGGILLLVFQLLVLLNQELAALIEVHLECVRQLVLIWGSKQLVALVLMKMQLPLLKRGLHESEHLLV